MATLVKGLIVAAIGLGLIAGNRDEIERFFDEVVLETRKITTAGDMRSICQMLDVHYIKKGRYPKDADFVDWMHRNFRENNIRDISEDNFGNAFIYTAGPSEKSFTLTSRGADGVKDTDDDFVISGP